MKTKRLLSGSFVWVLVLSNGLMSCGNDDHYENQKNHAELQATEKSEIKRPSNG